MRGLPLFRRSPHRRALQAGLPVWELFCVLPEYAKREAMSQVIHGPIKGSFVGSLFGIVTYTRTGYSDLVSRKAWRPVGGVEAHPGFPMCGLFHGLFFAVFTLIQRKPPAA
jgi:hypothetical protein